MQMEPLPVVHPVCGAPAFVQKRIVKDLDSMYLSEIILLCHVRVFDRAMIELFRGCTRGCRFCQAGHTYRPLRRNAQRNPATWQAKLFSKIPAMKKFPFLSIYHKLQQGAEK